MLAYIANFVKSLSLTFLTQPPHFEAIVGRFVMETPKKNEKANHPHFAYMYLLFHSRWGTRW